MAVKLRIAILLLAIPVSICASETNSTPVTFTKDVAPILYRNCVACHHANDIAPMSLTTYKEVRPWASAIRQAVVQRAMPPWHADPSVGEYRNDPRLKSSEIETIEAWVKSGAPEGDPGDLPPVPSFETADVPQ